MLPGRSITRAGRAAWTGSASTYRNHHVFEGGGTHEELTLLAARRDVAGTLKQEGARAMGYDQKTAERVRRILSGRRDVVEKKMIGGLSFMANGSICCGVTKTALMVRVGPEAREWALAQPHVRPMEFAGRPLAGFVCVDPEGFRTDTALASWLQRGIDFGSALPAKRSAVRKLDPKRRRKELADLPSGGE
jgi:hypothetical protein